MVKVGGSLLDLPDLAPRVAQILASLEPPAVLLPGGGPTCDLVRSWDHRFVLGEERSHRLALAALALNAALLAEALPGARLLRSRSEVEQACREPGSEAETGGPAGRSGPAVLDPAAFIATEEPGARLRLPHLWSAGSDAVAAWVAVTLGARELVLLKSRPPPRGAGIEDLCREGYLDPCFGALARELPLVRAVDLRGDAPFEPVILVT